MPERVFIALGSNLGDRALNLSEARAQIAALPDTTLEAESRVDDTAPLGGPGQGRYFNQMVLIHTGLSPRALLDGLLAIEAGLGRVRGERWAPRIIDLDIVRFGDRVVNEPGLTIPHPELPNRDFWQRELAELTTNGR
jgi:2-amino-4-hydroxy-6-hydroxymethyldihydropteridine diphosphokinase